jgi:hypothetical protein
MSEDQLRRLLAERSAPARNRPVPREHITARIRRARMKKAAGACLLAIAVAAGVVSGVHLAHDHASMTSYSGPPLPASFTAADGAAYHQLAVVSLTEAEQKTTTLTIHVGSDPVDIMGSCDRPLAGAYLGIKINGTYAALIRCQPAPEPIALPVHPGETASITFVPAASPVFPDTHANWRVAAYAWTPPATARPAPAAPHLPQSYTGPNTTAGQGTALRKLVAIRSGTWPRDRTATFTLTFSGQRSFDISTVCAGLIGGRLEVSHQDMSHQVESSWSEAVPCTPAGPGQLANGGGDLSGAGGERITLTFRLQAPSSSFAADYAKRAASWTIAIYEEQT